MKPDWTETGPEFLIEKAGWEIPPANILRFPPLETGALVGIAAVNGVLGTLAFALEELDMKLLPQEEEELPRAAYFDEPAVAPGIAILIVALPHLATGTFKLAPVEGNFVAIAGTETCLLTAAVFMPGLTTAPVVKRLCSIIL